MQGVLWRGKQTTPHLESAEFGDRIGMQDG
jgi:hypothetical protein